MNNKRAMGMNYQVYCDGSYKHKVGMCIGVSIFKVRENKIADEHYISKYYKCTGNTETVEVLAIRDALKELDFIAEKNNKIIIYTDNLSVVNKIEYKILKGEEKFITILHETLAIISEYADIQIKWIPRERNTIAHKLCKQLMKEKVLERKARRFIAEKVEGDKYIVRHVKRPQKEYVVYLNKLTCNCKWISKRKNVEGIKCKHIVAAQMKQTEINP